jgi:hypothetical protein
MSMHAPSSVPFPIVPLSLSLFLLCCAADDHPIACLRNDARDNALPRSRTHTLRILGAWPPRPRTHLHPGTRMHTRTRMHSRATRENERRREIENEQVNLTQRTATQFTSRLSPTEALTPSVSLPRSLVGRAFSRSWRRASARFSSSPPTPFSPSTGVHAGDNPFGLHAHAYASVYAHACSRTICPAFSSFLPA